MIFAFEPRSSRAVYAALALALIGASYAEDEYVAGYLIIPTGPRVERKYNAGYSMYVAAWPLLQKYPGHRFQTGLPGTWMFAQYDGEAPKDMYSDVEGGLGWWRDTRFPTTTPKFIMGGVGPNFSDIANGPAHGWGTWENPRGLYGVAQLSSRLLFPIDGLNVKQGTNGELFGYGYLNLPLAEAKSTTEGKPVPTGPNCWTLFLNTANFKGPVAFFTPHFWSHSAVKESRLVGQLLDTRPVDPNRQVQMETQFIPCKVVTASNGTSYARMAPTRFPYGPDGQSVLVHQNRTYEPSALYDSVRDWFAGKGPSTGSINPSASHSSVFPGGGYATWEVRTPVAGGKETEVPIDWKMFSDPFALDSSTYAYRWDNKFVNKSFENGVPLVTLPEYYQLDPGNDQRKPRWIPVSQYLVPTETGLQNCKWDSPREEAPEPYSTPEASRSTWKSPGPNAGPFKAHLGDGSVVTYYWYRFADQPAMLNADLTQSEREKIQKKVEKIHRFWAISHNYLPPPTLGKLANIDPACIVRPPKGLEIGYVPIATRQELKIRGK